MTTRIAMICMGNICRSPIAEHVLRKKSRDAGLDVHIESAGTGGWHVGDPADERAQLVLESAGYTHAHRAQKATRDWLESFHLVLAMDENNLKWLHRAVTESHHDKVALIRSFDESAISGAEVPDPYYGTIDDFREIVSMIEKACDGIVARLIRDIDVPK